MASGLPLALIDAIVKDCFVVQTLRHLQSKFSFFNRSHSVQIWQFISETIFNEFVTKHVDEENSDSSTSDDEADEDREVDFSDSSQHLIQVHLHQVPMITFLHYAWM